jgi:hypothetical protein
MDVPQVSGPLGEFPFDVEPGAIPVNQAAGGESMTHILQPGTAAVTLGSGAAADALGYLGERVSRYPFGNAPTLLGDEEGGKERCGEKAISGRGVLFQSRDGRRMNRKVTRFPELRPPDVQDAKLAVDIGSVQTPGFVHPHSGRYQ